jgi:drug/metabolite transporter (DMT)-like permease
VSGAGTLLGAVAASGVLFGLAAMLGWGVGDYFAALLSREADNLRALLWSTVCTVLVVVAVVALTRTPMSLTAHALPFVLGAGVLNACGGLAFYHGLRIGQVSLVSAISGGYAVVLVVTSVLFLGETLTPTQAFAVALLIGGSILVSVNLAALRSRHESLLTDPGLPYAFGAMFGWGLGFTLLTASVREVGWATANMLSSVAVVLTLVTFGLTMRRPVGPPAGRRSRTLTVLLGLCSAFAFVAYSIGVTSHPAVIVAPVSAAFPLVTILLARLLMAERMTHLQGVGVGLVMVGIVLASV